jgi:DNA gyrase/topoisomerase IV subunit A
MSDEKELDENKVTETALAAGQGQRDFNPDEVSDGVKYLTRGYIEYAQEVLCDRALPNVYDGLKPVNRRIVTTFWQERVKTFSKCAKMVGDILPLHPHGDASVYQAMVLMTDTNGSLAFPVLKGRGNFGGVYKTDPPAAARYTEIMLHQNADEYFGEMNGIKMIPNFDATMTEPEVLPVSFPAVLVNATSGIAVGFRSNIPSFNFNDVCDLVIEYITDGKCTTVISPDFVTGGYYIKNEKELQKLMRTGSAKLKLRGKATIVGKEIQVTEIPFGKTIQGIIAQINDKNIPAIRNAYDTDDFEHGAGFTVDCTAKARVDEALYAMYKETDFQYNFSADITVVKNGVPVKLGVWKIIEEWVAWRKGVLEREYTHRVQACKDRMREASAFMALINSSKKDDFIKTITTKGRDEGKKFLRNNWTREEIPEDLIDFVSNRPLNVYHTGGKYATEFAKSTEELNQLETALKDLNAEIIRQMNRLKNTYGKAMARKTEITTTDYEFTEKEVDGKDVTKFVDNTKCWYSLKGNFLKKTKVVNMDSDLEYSFVGTASDTLIAFDNRGRLLRIYCEDIPMYGTSDMGMYLPKYYFNLDETDDYKITWIGRITGQTLALLYTDGNIGFVDTNEWVGNNRRVKVLEKGIAPTCAPYLGKVLDVKDLPPIIVAMDRTGRFGVASTENLKHKDRTAKTRMITLFKNNHFIAYMGAKDEFELSMIFPKYNDYWGRMTKYTKGDIKGNLDDLFTLF